MTARRDCVRLSTDLVRQLHEYEPICRAEQSFLAGHGSSGRCRAKRTFDQLDDEPEPMDLTSA